MAFAITNQDPIYHFNKGSGTCTVTFTKALVAGTLTVSLPRLAMIRGYSAESQTSNGARVSATTANTITITGTSTDVVTVWVSGDLKS